MTADQKTQEMQGFKNIFKKITIGAYLGDPI